MVLRKLQDLGKIRYILFNCTILYSCTRCVPEKRMSKMSYTILLCYIPSAGGGVGFSGVRGFSGGGFPSGCHAIR